MGKSGHIAGKLAATLASTGTPSFFVHPGEASHGDVGMITRDDVLIALSNSGETGEILTIVPVIKRLGVPLIALTGDANSSLARLAGAGGIHEIPAYQAHKLPLFFGATPVLCTGQHVLTQSQGGEAESYYGVVGQDVLRLFSSYTLDFRTMRLSVVH